MRNNINKVEFLCEIQFSSIIVYISKINRAKKFYASKNISTITHFKLTNVKEIVNNFVKKYKHYQKKNVRLIQSSFNLSMDLQKRDNISR